VTDAEEGTQAHFQAVATAATAQDGTIAIEDMREESQIDREREETDLGTIGVIGGDTQARLTHTGKSDLRSIGLQGR
jgi:hypothetical protein